METGAFSSDSLDLDALNVQDGERGERHEDHDQLYMSQDHRSSSHRSNAPTRNARTDTSHSRRPRFQRNKAPPSASAREVGRKTNLRREIDRRQVDQQPRLVHPSLRQPSARTQAPNLSGLFPHRVSPSTAVSFKAEGSLNRRIETKLPIRQVLGRIVDMKQRLAGPQSKTPEEKGRLLGSVTQTVHEVLFMA